MWLVSLKLSLDSQECVFCHSSCQFMVLVKHSSQGDMNNTFFQIFNLSWTWSLIFFFYTVLVTSVLLRQITHMNTEVCVFPRISNSIYVVELSLDLDAKLVWTYKGFLKNLTSQLYLSPETASQVCLFWFLWSETCLNLSAGSVKLSWKSWICLFGRLHFHEMVYLFLGQPSLCRFSCLFSFSKATWYNASVY